MGVYIDAVDIVMSTERVGMVGVNEQELNDDELNDIADELNDLDIDVEDLENDTEYMESLELLDIDIDEELDASEELSIFGDEDGELIDIVDRSPEVY